MLAKNLDNTIPAMATAKRGEFTNQIIANCILNVYYAMSVIDEAICHDEQSILLKTKPQNDFWKKVFVDSIQSWYNIAKQLAKATLRSKASA